MNDEPFCVHIYYRPRSSTGHCKPSHHLHCPNCRQIWFQDPILHEGVLMMVCSFCGIASPLDNCFQYSLQMVLS